MNLCDAIAAEDATEAALKRRFAYLLLKYPNDPNRAAHALFGDDMGAVSRALAIWQHSPEILALKDKLVAELGAEEFLPTKEEFALEVWQHAQGIRSADERTKALKLFADTLGFIDSKGVNVNLTNIDSRVMVVHDHGTDDAWEAKLAEQQRKLVHGS